MANAVINVANLEELQNAISTATAEQTITLAQDIEINSPLTIDKATTINLAKHTLKGSIANALTVVKGATVIKGGTLEASAADAFVVTGATSQTAKLILGNDLTIKCHSQGLYAKTKGTLCIDNATLQSDVAGPAIRGEFTDTLIEIKNTNLEGTETSLISLGKSAKCTIEGSTLNVRQGEESNTPIIAVDRSNVSINKSTLSHENGFAIEMKLESTVNVKASTVTSTSINNATIKLTGESNILHFESGKISSSQNSAISVKGRRNSLDLLGGQLESHKDHYVLDLQNTPSLDMESHFKGKLSDDWFPPTCEWRPVNPEERDGFYYVFAKEEEGQEMPDNDHNHDEVDSSPSPDENHSGHEGPGQGQQDSGKLPESLNVKTLTWLYKTPSLNHPIAEWIGAIKVIGLPITHKPTGYIFLPVKVKLPGNGGYSHLYLLWKSTKSQDQSEDSERHV